MHQAIAGISKAPIVLPFTTGVIEDRFTVKSFSTVWKASNTVEGVWWQNRKKLNRSISIRGRMFVKGQEYSAWNKGHCGLNPVEDYTRFILWARLPKDALLKTKNMWTFICLILNGIEEWRNISRQWIQESGYPHVGESKMNWREDNYNVVSLHLFYSCSRFEAVVLEWNLC